MGKISLNTRSGDTLVGVSPRRRFQSFAARGSDTFSRGVNFLRTTGTPSSGWMRIWAVKVREPTRKSLKSTKDWAATRNGPQRPQASGFETNSQAPDTRTQGSGASCRTATTSSKTSRPLNSAGVRRRGHGDSGVRRRRRLGALPELGHRRSRTAGPVTRTDRRTDGQTDATIIPAWTQLIVTLCYNNLVSNVNATVLHAQKYKHVHYANCVPPIDPRRIIAFAIDATGRLGPDAKAFLFKTCGTETFRRSKFLKKVSMTCARAVGKILNSSRVRLALPQNGAA